MASPLEFIGIGTRVQALWKTDDVSKWYPGTVIHIHETAETAQTAHNYIECDVQYEDMVDKHCRFYVDDYGDEESEDAWKFVQPLDATLTVINGVIQRLEDLEASEKKESRFSLRGLIWTSVVMVAAYGVAFWQYENLNSAN